MAQKAKIFIDGEHGTTGLQIRERLASRKDLNMLSVPAKERRNADLRAKLLNEADIVILCLPDDASREAVAMLAAADNNRTRVIDASTAHRANPDWVFGFAEMTSGHREAIAAAMRVSNPGCYSTGAIALIRPLVESGLLPRDYPITINAVSGYTGGGKTLIARMEDSSRDDHIKSQYFLYALTLSHKHLPEIIAHCGLERTPIFTPSVGRFRQGMLVSVPLHTGLLRGDPSPSDIRSVLARHYKDSKYVAVTKQTELRELERLDPEDLTGTDKMKLYAFENSEGQLVNLVASLDNLGKGASGAAVQNLDIMLGL